MDIDINEIGKSIAQITSAVSRVLPVLRNWRKKPESTPEQLATIDEAIESIRKGISSQQQLALLFDPQIDNHNNASQLVSTLEKMLEFSRENSQYLVQSSELAENSRHSFRGLFDDLQEFEVTFLKRISDDDFRFLQEKDRSALQKAAQISRAENAAIKQIIETSNWDIEVLQGHIREMRLAALDMKKELSSNLKLLVEILAYSRF